MGLTLLSSVAALGFLLFQNYGFSAYLPRTTTNDGKTIVQSKRFPGISVSFKNPGICEQTPGVKEYAGYVHIPPNTLDVKQEYPINTFFWFFEAHKDPKKSPTTVWTNGGPGSSSMLGLFAEMGPCEVLADSKTVVSREWAWNRASNMLFIDQPVQVGFSYDTVNPGIYSYNVTTDDWTAKLVNDTASLPENNNTFFKGNFPSLKTSNTANLTSIAAEAFWYFIQGWTEAFEQYMPADSDPEISIFAESYGGHYGPRFSAYLEHKNDALDSETLRVKPRTAPVPIRLQNLGLVSACVDYPIQYAGAFVLGVNNTYGIPFLNESIASALLDQYTRPGGCRDHYVACGELFEKDPFGDQGLVNQCIRSANNGTCDIVNDQDPRTQFEYVYQLGLNRYDFTHKNTDPFPWNFWRGYLMDADVQAAIGSPVNFTGTSPAVSSIFSRVQDRFTPGYRDDLAYLLDKGIHVTVLHGDRDFACNWYGGEMTSLAVNYSAAEGFRSAGYEKIRINESAFGGEVRQFGNFSFIRVYESGHESPSYAPEASFRIFERTLNHVDIATGTKILTDDYASTGPSKSTSKSVNEGPGFPPICYIPGASTDGCTKEQKAALANGTAVVKDYVVISPPGSPVQFANKPPSLSRDQS